MNSLTMNQTSSIKTEFKKHKKLSIIKKLKKEKEIHLMILPSLIVVILMAYFPMYGIIIAFKKYDLFKGFLKSPWASSNGFEHFIDFFNSPFFSTVITNTIIIAALKLTLLALPPVILAVMLNEIRHSGFKRISQTISYLPHFISWIILGGIIYNLFSLNGPVNMLLLDMGIIEEPFHFMASTGFFRPLVVLSELWKEVGWGSIIYLAVIATIDLELYNAIEIDGGGRWAKIIHITWPSLKGTFMILFILSCGSIMSGNGGTFEQSYVLGNSMNKDVSDILDIFILRVGLENARYSFSTAAGLFKSIINLILLLSANKLSKVLTEKSLF